MDARAPRACPGPSAAASEPLQTRLNLALSACDSAATDATNPGGGDNLPTAFLGRCARSVLAALWPIDDEATRDLMAAFYLGLTLTDRTREWALREAILRIREERRFPREWAPFVLVGAPGLVQGAQTP